MSEAVRVIQEELDAVPGPDAPTLADRIAIALGGADLLWRASDRPSESRDATRYRWLRQHPAFETEALLGDLSPEEFDKLADERMRAESLVNG